MPYTHYPYTDYNNLNLDWLIDQTRENTDDIALTSSGLTTEIQDRQNAVAGERAARIAADRNLQNQIDILSPTGLQDYVTKNKRSLPGQVLLIGDSYLAGWTPDGDVTSWGAALAGMLDKTIGTDIFEYALGGAGLVNAIAGRTFRSLLSEAAADPAIDTDKVSTIIVGGGWNDRGFSGQVISAAVVQFFADAKSLYPNAIVYVANMGYGIGSSYSAYMKANVSDGYGRLNPIGDIWTVLSTYRSIFLSSDNVHPNSDGNTALARAIYNKIFTGDYTGDIYGPVNISSGQANMTLNVEIKNHWLYVTNYSSGAGASIALSGLSGQGNGTVKVLEVTGCPWSAANYAQFVVPALFYTTAYLRGHLIVRLNGDKMEFYALCLNANGSNWQSLSAVSTMYVLPFSISAPLAAI